MPKKRVACLEGEWYGWNDRTSIRPMLDMLRLVTDAEYQWRPCYSKEQLGDELRELGNHPAYKLVDISVHGGPGRIYVGGKKNEQPVELEELAELMSDRFAGRVVHLGGCETLNCGQQRIHDFVRATGVSLVTGFRRYTDWVDGAAFEFLFLATWNQFKLPGAFRNGLLKRYPDLVKRLGFAAYPEGSHSGW